MSLITNQKLKNLQSEIDDLKETIQSLTTSIININTSKAKYYTGFSPTQSIGAGLGPNGRTAGVRIKNDQNIALTASEFIDVPIGSKMVFFYGLSAYRVNGTVGNSNLRFDVFDTYDNDWLSLGNNIKIFIDPTQNQESKNQCSVLTATRNYRFQNISIVVISNNTVVDGNSYPYWLMKLELP